MYTYVEYGSKNNSGGLKQLKVKNKTVPCPAVPANRPRCLVYLLDEYFKRLPSFAYEQDILYLRPKKNVTDTDTIWYDCTPVGKNTLGTMLKSMCKEAQIEEKSNHSLRATGATAMFRANVPEGVIQKTTGHRNLQCFCTYERISTNQHEEVSKLLMGDFIKESKLHVPVSTAKNSSDSQTTEISTDVASCDTGTSNSSTLIGRC